MRRGEDVGALGHEVDAAEEDELGVAAAGGLLRELEGVAAEVGELDHLVALVVVAEDDQPLAELPAQRPDPRVALRGVHLEVLARDALLAQGTGPVAAQASRRRRRPLRARRRPASSWGLINQGSGADWVLDGEAVDSGQSAPRRDDEDREPSRELLPFHPERVPLHPRRRRRGDERRTFEAMVAPLAGDRSRRKHIRIGSNCQDDTKSKQPSPPAARSPPAPPARRSRRSRAHSEPTPPPRCRRPDRAPRSTTCCASRRGRCGRRRRAAGDEQVAHAPAARRLR